MSEIVDNDSLNRQPILPVMHSNSLATFRQWISGFIVSMGMWNLGSALGWSSPSSPQLEDGKYISSIPQNQVSWIASIVMLAALVGCFLTVYVLELIGRKYALMGATIPSIAGWTLVATGQNFWMLLVGRILIGLAGGVFCVAGPVYSTEMLEERLRSNVMSWFAVAPCVGILYTYVIGALVSWRVNAVCCGATAIVVLFGMAYLPETPRYLIVRGNRAKASSSLQWFRGTTCQANVLAELDKLSESVEQHETKDEEIGEKKQQILVASTVKPVAISVACMALQQLSGTSAVTFYTVDIFEAAGSEIEPNICGIIYGATQLVMTAVAGLLLTKFGRRPLYIFSEAGMCLGLLALGAFYFLKENEYESVNSLSWLPLVSLMAYTISYCCGAGFLVWIVMADLCPPHVKGAAAAMCMGTAWGLGFLVALLFPSLLDWIKGYGAFWLFSGFNVFGTLFIIFVLPETRDKTMDEIAEMFK